MEWARLNPLSAVGEANLRYEKWWKDHLKGRNLRTITSELVDGIIKEHRTGVNSLERTPANATANAYVSFVSRVITETSHLRPKLLTYPEVKGRIRWLTPAEWFLLSAKMEADFRDLCEFALATGLRRGNCMDFDWRWVHDDWALIPHEFTKTGEDYGIPLNRTAQAVIARRKASTVRHPNLVFLNGGKPWSRMSVVRYMQDAVEKAEIEPVTFHGFRHTFASWLAQRGVSDSIKSRLGCWASVGISGKYTHFDVDSLRPYSEIIDTMLADGVKGLTFIRRSG